MLFEGARTFHAKLGGAQNVFEAVQSRMGRRGIPKKKLEGRHE